jgi:hypothetical protein
LNKATAPKRWQFVSDKAVAVYLGLRSNGLALKDLLVHPLEKAIGNGLKLIEAHTCQGGDSVKTVLQGWAAQDERDGQPVLVMRAEPDELFGILTPEDLL